MSDQDRRVPRGQAYDGVRPGREHVPASYDCEHANEVPASGSKDSNPKDHAATTKLPLWLLSPVAKAWWSLAQLAGLFGVRVKVEGFEIEIGRNRQ